MIWALLEITLPLCLTFLFGLIAGWLLWRWRRRQISATEWNALNESNEGTDQEAFISLRTEHESILTERDELQVKLASLASTVEEQNKELAANNDSKQLALELKAAKLKIESLSAEASSAPAQTAAPTNGLTTMYNEATARAEKLSVANDELQQKLKQAETAASERDTAIAKIKELENSQVTTKSDSADAELTRTKAQLAALDTKFKNFQASVVSHRENSEQVKDKLRAKVALLQAEVSAAPKPATSSPADANKIAEMQSKLQQANSAYAELNQAKAQITNLESQLSEAKLKAAQAIAMDTNAGTTTQGQPASQNIDEGKINELNQKLAFSNRQIKDLGSKNAELTKMLETTGNNGQSKDTSVDVKTLSETQKSLAEAKAQLNREKARSAELEANLAKKAVPTSAHVTSISVGQVKKLKAELSVKEEKIAQLEKKLKSKTPKQTGKNDWQQGTTKLGTPGSNHKDDLTKINGIGPKIEKVLNGLGIKSWEQLATLKAAEIKAVDDALTDFSGRIQRDEWVPQAKAIMANGHLPLKKNAAKKSPAKKTATKTATKAKKNAWQKGETKFGTPGAAHKDDLKVINGIGPVLEKSLNKFGVKSWEQLAALSAKEAKKIDEKLAFPGRIAREEWIRQAKELVKIYPDHNARPSRRTVLKQVASR